MEALGEHGCQRVYKHTTIGRGAGCAAAPQARAARHPRAPLHIMRASRGFTWSPSVHRVLLVVPLATLSVHMGQTAMFAIMPMLGRTLGFHELQITALVSLSALTFFLLSPRWGRYSDRVGRKPVLMTGLIGYGVGTMAFIALIEVGLAGAMTGWVLYAVLLMYRVMHTSVMAATHPAAAAYVVDVTPPASRARGMGYIGGAVSLGAMLGPGLVWFVEYGLLVPLYLAVAVMAPIVLALWFLLPARPVAAHGGPGPGLSKRLRYTDPRYRWLLLIGLVMYATLSMVQHTLGFYFQDRLGLGIADAAKYFATGTIISSAAMMFSQIVLVRYLNWPPDKLVRFGLPVVALGYGALALASELPHFMLGMGLFGMGMGLATPGYSAAATLQVQPHEQGELAGITGSIAGLGFVIGPLFGGGVYVLNPSLPYIAASIVVVPLIALVWSQRMRAAMQSEASMTSGAAPRIEQQPRRRD